MKKTLLIFISLITLLINFSCKEKTVKEQVLTPKVLVKTATVKEGNLPDYLEFSGNTIYLNKNTIIAPISGYITKVNIRPGDAVSKNKLLFIIQSQESYALRNTELSSINYGVIKIHAPVNGIVNQQNIFKNSVFVDKGSQLCDIVESNGLFVETEVPFEFSKFAKIGSNCNVLLPDSTNIEAKFTKILPQMNKQSQTVKVLAKMKGKSFIPENMIVKILVNKFNSKAVQILPKTCIMTDALMTKFWVMKLSDEEITVKVPVKLGNKTHTQVEILSPVFDAEDQIISEGAYGLEEGVKVEIKKTSSNK